MKILKIIFILALLIGGWFVIDKYIGSDGGTFMNNGKSTDGDLVYLSSDEIFSFSYPSDFTFSTLEDDAGGETTIFSTGNPKRNFQIYVTEYSDTEPVTIAKIKRELPELIVEDGIDIAIAGAAGSVFTSSEKGSDFKTREIWFSRDGKLYQISTVKEFDDEMARILETWTWN